MLDCAPSTSTDILTAEAHTIKSYEIFPSTVPDDTIRGVIQDVRTSMDIQKLWFTGKSTLEFSIKRFQPRPRTIGGNWE